MALGKIMVDGAGFSLTADSPALGGVTSITVTVNSSSHFISEGNNAVLKSDMEGQSPVGPVPYTTADYPLPGGLTWDGKLYDSQESVKLTKDSFGVIVDDTNSGSVNWNVTVPASRATPPPLTDTTTTYEGTWNLTTTNQTKVNTVE